MRRKIRAGAAVALLLFCLPLLQAKAASKAEVEQKIQELERETEKLSRQLEEMNIRLEMILNRLESLEKGPPVSPAEAEQDASQKDRSSVVKPPSDLEVIKLKPEPAPVITSTSPAPVPRPKSKPTPWPKYPVFRVRGVPVASHTPPDESYSPEKELEIMALYHEGLQFYEKKDYQGAVEQFEDFISNFKGEKNLDGAHYWLGECYNNLGERDDALLNLKMVTEEYPESPKAPEALFRTGTIHLEQKDYDEAREAFRNLIILYPFSALVKEAEEELKQINTRD